MGVGVPTRCGGALAGAQRDDGKTAVVGPCDAYAAKSCI